MKTKKEMPQQESDKAPVTFQDVAACFSEEEWKLLHKWQKELYNNVMKEIHQAWISLGPVIATSVFSLRAKEGDYVYPTDHQDSERRRGNNHSLRFPSLNSDIIFRIEQDVEGSLMDDRASEEGLSNTGPSSGHEAIIPITSFSINEGETYAMGHEGPEKKENVKHIGSVSLNPESKVRCVDHIGEGGGGENIVSSRSVADPLSPTRSGGFPFLSADYCVRSEDESSVSFMGHPGAEGGESSTDPRPEHMAIPEVVLVHIKEEEDTYSMDLQNGEIIESISSVTGDGSTNRQTKAGESIAFTKKTPCKASSKKKNSKVLKSSHKGAHSTSQLRSESYQDMGGDKTTQCESASNNSDHISLYQERPKAEISQKYNEYENSLRNSQFVDGLPHTQQNKTQYACSEFDTSYSLKGELITHTRTHSGVRPYACTDCDKSFLQKRNLILHLRTHTGEKPYTCTFCQKRFSRKDNLNRHRRIHTAVERNWASATRNAEHYPNMP